MTLRGARILSSCNDASNRQEQNMSVNIKVEDKTPPPQAQPTTIQQIIQQNPIRSGFISAFHSANNRAAINNFNSSAIDSTNNNATNNNDSTSAANSATNSAAGLCSSSTTASLCSARKFYNTGATTAPYINNSNNNSNSNSTNYSNNANKQWSTTADRRSWIINTPTRSINLSFNCSQYGKLYSHRRVIARF